MIWKWILAGLAFLLLLVVLNAMDWIGQVCIDRRDYAPGYNTYRLVRCADIDSYRVTR